MNSLRQLTLFLFAAILVFNQTSAQQTTLDQGDAPEWKVGVYEFPPFMFQNGEKEWKGVSIELWQDLADSLDITYEYHEIASEKAHDLLQNQSLHAVLLHPVSADTSLKFSHIYHTSLLGIASSQTQSLSSIMKGLFTMRFLRIVIMLSILLLIAGTIMWFIERKTNNDSFGGERNPLQGIGSGFWWAGVTMTTIGYGDKAPVTFWGRAVALLWMLVAMAVTASLTAALVSVVGGTTASSISVPDGLRKKDVGTVADSPFGKYLSEQNIQFKTYDSAEQGLKEVANQKLSIFVHNTPTMRYWVNENSNLTVQVENSEVLPQRYGIAFPPTSSVDQVNQKLLKIINQSSWRKRINKYMPK